MIEIREPKKEEFDSYYIFRWELLRKPWAQSKGSEKDDFEDIAYHIIATPISTHRLPAHC